MLEELSFKNKSNLRKCLYLITLLLLLSCSDSKERKFQNCMNDYIRQYPMSILRIKDSVINIPHPSYHVYFDKNNAYEDEVLIKLSPFYIERNVKMINDSLVYSPQKAKGVFYYNKKPIIVFDNSDLSSKYIKDKLIKEIPDSLKLNGTNVHIKSKFKLYQLNNDTY